jgi:organic radical activating enzyme
MYDLSPLMVRLIGVGKHIHLETSGTIEFDTVPVWVTVAPKVNFLMSMLERADEIKLLVDEKFDPVDPFLEWAARKPVYLHPVNGEHTVNAENLKLCRDWQIKFPQYRIGLQLHKAIEHYIHERVR